MWLRRLAKAAGAEPHGQIRDENVHAVVARSTFGSQIWKSECPKHTILAPPFEVHRSKKHTQVWCEAHFEVNSVSKKSEGFGALLEVEMLKKCTPLWREAHFDVKMYKTPQPRNTFGS